MKIRIKLSTFFGSVGGAEKTELDLHQGATVKDALEKIVHDFPKLKKWLPQYAWVFINGNHVELQTQLKKDDEISVFPPIGGG